MAESRVITDTITGEVPGYTNAGPARFLYNPADPYAIVVDLTALVTRAEQRGKTVLWEFARSLLVRALTGGHAGDGDVVIDRDGAWVDIALSSPDGAATFRFPAQPLHRFILRTESLVLLGDESRHYAPVIDDTINRLLGGVR